MSEPLFDRIHNSVYRPRTNPATLDDFVQFGLEPIDYVQYIGLLHCLQGELLLYRHPQSLTTLNEQKIRVTTYPTVEQLIRFCKENNLIEADSPWDDQLYPLFQFVPEDAEYFHDWIRFPKDFDEFRLCIERKFSSWWDVEDDYIARTFGAISFVYDDYIDFGDDRIIEPGSPVRIKKFNPETKDFSILGHSEVKKIFQIAQQEKRRIEKEFDEQIEKMPARDCDNVLQTAVPWVKKLCELWEQQRIIEGVFETIERAANTEDIYKFKDSDTLNVVCEKDKCKEEGHLVKSMRVEFGFYTKPNKQFTINRCSHCKHFYITLEDLINMFDTYDVPRCKIIYDDDQVDFSGFPEVSFFYKKGYSVSESAGLTKEKRQSILRSTITSGEVSKHQVLSFLERRIQRNGRKAGNELACRKWKEDHEYIRNL